MRLIALDTETHLIGPGAVVPKLVCVSFAEMGAEGQIRAELLSHVDEGLEERLREYLTLGKYRLVFHNAAFDIPVLCKAFPALEPLWWRKLEAGEVSDTMLREQLLNLSTVGKLEVMEMPDGSSKQLRYGLADLVMEYLDVDISAEKDEDDAWRVNYDKLDGLRADQYPEDARNYALQDAIYPLQIYELQEDRVQSEAGYASLSTETFQTAVSVALTWITAAGMRIDKEEFRRMAARLADELSDQRMEPLYRAGILNRPVPALPYKRQETKAAEMVAEWLGISPDDVDWARLDPDLQQALLDAGIKFKKAEESSVDTATLRHRVTALSLAFATGCTSEEMLALPQDCLEAEADARGVKLKRTKTGEISTDKDVIQTLASSTDDDPIRVFQARQKLQKLVTTELPRMTWQGEPADTVHFCYKTIVETSRTSSFASKKYPSGNGQNIDPRARPALIPRDGHLLCSADYATLELVCTAQTTYDILGKSIHRDKINAGYDLHAYLGSHLATHLSPWFREAAMGMEVDVAYQFFLGLKKEKPDFFKAWRKLAKPVGLGFPGGLGPQKLVEIARKEPYLVDIVKMAMERYKETPEEFEPTKRVLFYAKKLHRMEPEDFKWTPALLGVALADRLRDIWLRTYPEMAEYFDWVKQQKDDNNPPIKMPDEDDPDREVDGLCYTTPMGMHRARATFTAVANGRCMQSPAAEGFKCAIFNVVRASRDPWSTSPLRGTSLIVNEVHDEILSELREDIAHELAMEKQRLMEEAMGMVISDVRVKVEPCLMRRWYKLAEPVYKDGRLVPWEPEVKA